MDIGTAASFATLPSQASQVQSAAPASSNAATTLAPSRVETAPVENARVESDSGSMRKASNTSVSLSSSTEA
ncbi:MAG: hypothetical protein P8144_12315 [Gammaproteobacteria bacterium]|jgi:hypothetical protein